MRLGRLILILGGLFFACSKDTFVGEISASEKVYICKGTYSKSYHYDPECKGLRSCTTEIFEIEIESAQQKGRTLCGYEK